MPELTDREQQALTDGENVQNMLDTPGWRKFASRIEEKIEQLRRDLESCPLEYVERCRGEILALRWALRVPQAFLVGRQEALEKLREAEGSSGD